jgi:ATP-binding cassette subfamily C protein
MTPIEDVFRREGRPIVFNPNRPLRLDDQDAAFLIMEGTVDVFAVPLADGQAAGARIHLHRVDSPGLLLGLSETGSNPAVALLAVPGLDAQAMGLPRARFLSLLREGDLVETAGRFLSGWISALATGRTGELVPRDAIELKAGPPVALSPGKTARASGDLVWISRMEGGFNLLGREEAAVGVEVPTVPLTGAIWLRIREPVVLKIETLAEYIEKEPDLPGLAHYHRLILAMVAADLERREKEAEDRRRRQADYQQKAQQDALRDIAMLMADSRDQSPKETAPMEEPLLAACRMVGGALGIAVQPSPRSAEKQGLETRLDSIARASRMRIRRVLLTGAWWHKNHDPLLGFWKNSERPCSLLREGQRRTRLWDPENGSTRLVDAAVAEELEFFAYQFYRPLPDRPVSAGGLARFAARRLRGDLWAVLVLGGLGALLGLAIPIGTGIVYSAIIPEAARNRLVQLAAGLFVCALGAALLDIVKGLAILRIETKSDADIQSAVMDRLLSLPVAFFRRFSAGDLAQRVLGMAVIRDSVTIFTTQSGIAGLFAAANLALMFWYDVSLALVALVFITAVALLLLFVTVLKIKRVRLMTDMEGRITGMILQFIEGISKLRVAGAETLAFARWAKDFSRQKRVAYLCGSLRNLQTLSNAVFPALGLLLLFGWVSAYRSVMGTGTFLAFLAAYTNAQTGLVQLFSALGAALEAAPLFERMSPILQTTPEIDDSKASPGELSGELEISSVTFRYQEDGPEVLKDVSLKVQPGQFVALVGGSGSGKSTLLRLLLGFEQPQSGGIYFDGKDLSTLDLREVRRQIGVVLQGGSVMPGSILDNIRGAANYPLEDVWEAARMAGMEQDIRDMPMGLHTFVSPGGENLSGGQRQRLLIARALIRKPRILFFDEATSALDNRTQDIVSQSLTRLKATRLVIAHRLSTVIGADCIYVLEKGRIIESGRYDELMKQNGPFTALVRRQIL